MIPFVLANNNNIINYKSKNLGYIKTSVISRYLIFGYFKNGVENSFSINQNYYTYNIKYYIKIYNNFYETECIYYLVNKNLNNNTIINASNIKIIKNITFINNSNNNYHLHEFCKTLENNTGYTIGIIIGIALVLIVFCFCVNCLYNDNNYNNIFLF